MTGKQAKAGRKGVVQELVRAHGRTSAEEAGITLKDTPQPLYRLLVLALLLSARIRGSIAVEAARELYRAGLRDPQRMAEADWQVRVDALGRGGYRRYGERTAAQLGDGAQLLTDRWAGDLRQMRKEADGDVAELRRLLQEVPGPGPAGAGIYLREAQRVWPEAAPYLDRKALDGAERLGLPKDPDRLVKLAGDTEPAVLAAAMGVPPRERIRAWGSGRALDKEVAEDSLRRAA